MLEWVVRAKAVVVALKEGLVSGSRVMVVEAAKADESVLVTVTFCPFTTQVYPAQVVELTSIPVGTMICRE